ncbi:NADH-quinone oxidoreductase subunit L [Streptomyces badius]
MRICIEACPTRALTMTNEFELAFLVEPASATWASSIAIMLMFTTFGTFAFGPVLAVGRARRRQGKLTAIGLMLLLAACGKSAQVPLQSWLGDAMEGPTPVSALIHAATMVTAGVYLIVRSGAIFNAAPDAQLVVVIVGAVTLIFGAIVGCAKDDIKKALAGSTMSQIGYMILAAGLGPIGYIFAIMHLVTHGFFKAGLFLGAGSVMHGMNDEVDMRKYGGLRKYMPVTFITFGLGYLAIIGFPGLSGFFSKDKIIEAAFAKGGTEGWILGSVALLGAAITAFYMTRVMLMTFFGEKRWQPDTEGHEPHPHESPKSMTIPMIVLAFGSVFAGGFFAIGDRFVNWLEPVTGYDHGHSPLSAATVTGATVVALVAGVGIAWAMYGRKPVPVVAPRGSVLTRAARRDLLQDDFNHVVLVRGGEHLTRSLVYVDHSLVDGVVNGTAASVGGLSGRMRKLQNGYARTYAVSMFGGAAVVIAATLLMRAV